MDRQRLLDTFLERVNGRGRAVNATGMCVYRHSDHPGCAIGCQPGFAEVAPGAGGKIRDVIKSYPEIISLFAIESDEDVEYLDQLQDLHDLSENWDGEYLRPKEISRFCAIWHLESPSLWTWAFGY